MSNKWPTAYGPAAELLDAVFEQNSPYIDDFIWSEEDPYKCIDTFFEIVDKLNYDKIHLIQDRIKALGKIVDGDLVRLDDETKEKFLVLHFLKVLNNFNHFLVLPIGDVIT